MSEIGVFTPDQARQLWHDYLARKRLPAQQTKHYPQRRPIDEPSPHRVFVKNTETTEDCPAYGCMEITGTEEVGGVTCVSVRRPTTTTGQYLFCSQFGIAAQAAGWAYRFGVVIMLGAPPSVSGAGYQPIVDSWEIEEGGSNFVVWGSHNADYKGLIGRFAGTATGSQRIRFTIADVHCPDAYDPELWIAVDWTWYTGGCGATPPGVEYDGTIKVYDSCILDYYTAGDLIGKEGSATYFYPRGSYCEPRWIVDAICGQPECDL